MKLKLGAHIKLAAATADSERRFLIRMRTHCREVCDHHLLRIIDDELFGPRRESFWIGFGEFLFEGP